MSFEASLKVGDGAYTYYPVSEIEGAAQRILQKHGLSLIHI